LQTLLLIASSPLVVVVAGYEPVEITSSVILVGEHDIKSPYSRCIPIINAARKTPQSSIHFVITMYWFDVDDDNVPEYYCYDRSGNWKSGRCTPVVASTAATSKLTDQLTPCFKHAVEQGFDIAITAHLDDGNMAGVWRNSVKFEPQRRGSYNGQETFSYEEAMLFPIADAIKRAAKANTKVIIM
jgi:hypothetical protein